VRDLDFRLRDRRFLDFFLRLFFLGCCQHPAPRLVFLVHNLPVVVFPLQVSCFFNQALPALLPDNAFTARLYIDLLLREDLIILLADVALLRGLFL